MISSGAVPTVAILGGGRLGTAVAGLLAPSPARVMLWARRQAVRTKLGKALRGCTVVPSLQEACVDADLVIIAVPASGVREIM
ncbi:MAG: NAD(P)-binding domain-containing protein, partial [Myxococcota bacterium]|nr:NAD(P)-binding domain-containing protein [Myxococcota bacterium]